MLVEIVENDVATIVSQTDSEFFKGKSVVLTGASGLIGTYLLAYFAHLNQCDYGVETTAITHSEPADYLAEIAQKGGIKLRRIDLTQSHQYSQIPQADIIIHAAGYAQPSVFMAKPINTLAINASATLALLAKVNEGGSFLFYSSSEIYCEGGKAIYNERDCGTSTPYHPRAAYIEGKRFGEASCAAYAESGTRAIAIRLGDIYGPGTRMDDQRALNSFVQQALTKKQITPRDEGAALRTYCYLTDAIEASLNILAHGKEQVYNVGGPALNSIRELALTIGEIVGVPVVFPNVENKIAGAPQALNLDITRLQTEINKKSFVDLNEGLRRTIAWQSKLYEPRMT